MKHPDDVLLSAWLEDDLDDAAQRAWISDHVEVCIQCRDAVQELTALARRAGEEPPEWPGKEAAWELLRERLGGAQPSTSPMRGGTGRPKYKGARWGWRLWLPTGAAASLAVILAALLMRSPASVDPSVLALLAEDAVVARTLESATGSEGAAGSQAVWSANRMISQGVDDLERALRARPGDPALTMLLRRAVEHRAQLLTEMPR